MSPLDQLDEAVRAIRSGDVETLRRLLAEIPSLATARTGMPFRCRTLLHEATDWPGHLPRVAESIRALVSAGADVNAPFLGRAHAETPLHWAASSDDVDALNALVEAGADIEAPGAVIGGGTPLADAVAFGQWRAARRLVDLGARMALWEAAALGHLDVVRLHLEGGPTERLVDWSLRPASTEASAPDDITHAFWCACHGGQQATAEFLLERGADPNWVGYDGLTALGAARRSGAEALCDWLAEELRHRTAG